MAIYVRNKEGVMESYKIVGLKGEKGQDGTNGQDGVTPNITIGTVTTLEAGEKATVTREGTKENPVFNFGIPRGQDGTGGGNASIDDTTISKEKTWSSSKIEDFVLTNNNTIWKDVNGENLSIEHTKEGYLREVEILGNTIQNQDNLEDIQHLGELYVDDDGKPKLDSQGRKQYKIDITSHKGLAYKNIQYNGGRHLGNNRYSLKPNGAFAMCNFLLNPNDVNVGDKFKIIFEIESKTDDISWEKVSMNYFTADAFGNSVNFEKKIGKRQVIEGTIQRLPQPLSNLHRFVLIQADPSIRTGEIIFKMNIIFEKESHKTTVLTPCQLSKVGDISDRLYWDKNKGRYVVEKNVDNYTISKYPNIRQWGKTYAIDGTGINAKSGNSALCISDKIKGSSVNSMYGSGSKGIAVSSSLVTISNGVEGDLAGVTQWVNSLLPIKVIHLLETPQLIETNITEELKLPTYINNTYISVTGGIDGGIKAKAPVDGGKVIKNLQRENMEIKATNDKQDELINTTMLATDEMFMMLEPLLSETVLSALESLRSTDKLVDMYAVMVKRGIKSEDEINEKYRDKVMERLKEQEGR